MDRHAGLRRRVGTPSVAGPARRTLTKLGTVTTPDRPTLVLGLPLVWAYLFAVWAVLVVAVAVLSRRGD